MMYLFGFYFFQEFVKNIKQIKPKLETHENENKKPTNNVLDRFLPKNKK